MRKFPRVEAEIVALAQQVINGLQENPYFPSPPISSSDLRNRLDAFLNSKATKIAHHATAEQSTEVNLEDLKLLVLDLKTVISYAVHASNDNDAQLNTIGWSARAPQTPLAVPGQPRQFEVIHQVPGEFSADWKRPIDGGEPACYLLKRRKRAEGAWETVGTFFAKEVELEDQERGVELEFCVVAANKAGEGVPSNSITIVL